MADIKLLTYEQGFDLVGKNSLPPNNEILLDDKGNPSVMVKIPKMTYQDLGLQGTGTFPAWIVDGKEVPYIYISKYQNIVKDGRAYSLPYQEPGHNVTFDEAVQYCETKGNGWHLMSNVEWQAIALWCAKNNCMPGGNNNGSYGDYYQTSQKGAPMLYLDYYDENNPESYDECTFTATGSGDKSWFHNNDFSGIADLNGNVYEWVGGIRMNAGEFNIIPDNNTVLHVDQSASSSEWKAILPGTTINNATLVAPGTNGVLINKSNGGLGVKGTDTAGSSSGTAFSRKASLASTSISSKIPKEAYAHGFVVPDITTERQDYTYYNNSGEKLCYRGGYFCDNYDAGVFCSYCDFTRSDSWSYLGFRSAFVPLQSE